MDDLLILVDDNDNEIGLMEKHPVHKQGRLHRAFSVFIFNSNDELLLQQRADNKYHSAALWSNTCCSHPLHGEPIYVTIKKRLREEMGIECDTRFQFSFIYKTEFENGLTEYEFDHVYFGQSDNLPVVNPLEVKDWKYISLDKLQQDILENPNDYSAWLKICLTKIIQKIMENKRSDS
jgi:isopentenyl-diphosphate delta-isomerase